MSSKSRIEAALHLSVLDAREPVVAGPDGKARSIHVAIGDAQAPLGTFLGILELHRLLGDDGRLKSEVSLVSIGNHFDYGPTAWRRWATDEGLQLLAWLSAHPSDQVTLIFGNHDYARVGELGAFDQPTYVRAREDADRAYRAGDRSEAMQQAFLARWPMFPDSEMVARDYSSFSTRQRGLVTVLLRSGRFRIAHAYGERLLLVHAGVTRGDLEAIGAPQVGARQIAEALNRFLDEAVARWSGGVLSLAPLHRASSRELGEARGVLAHRPAHPAIGKPEQFEGPPRRRFDPREVPSGLTQVVGHIRDGKSRDLLGEWAHGEGGDGPLRQLSVNGQSVRYERGCSGEAAMLFIDGGMNYAPIDRYELLDLDTVQPRVKLAISGT